MLYARVARVRTYAYVAQNLDLIRERLLINMPLQLYKCRITLSSRKVYVVHRSDEILI